MNYESNEVSFQSGSIKINGTLIVPSNKENLPVVVMIQGSGPMDRDETIGPNKPFKELAENLASNGVASLRFDKRTFTYQKEIAKEKTITIKEEVIEDAISAIDFLKKKDEFSHYFLIGHSLGAWTTPLIASKLSLDGIVMLCTPGRYIFELMLLQNKFQIKERKLDGKKYKQQLEEMEKIIQKIKKKEFSPEDVVLNVPSSYWYSFMESDPRKLIKKLKIPILLIHGGNDCQIYQEDFKIWKNATKNMSNVTIEQFKDVNHILVEYPEKSTGKEYNEKMSISKKLTSFLTNWIKRNS